MINPNTMINIQAYCEVNNIDDIGKLVNKMLLRGFTIEKYGETPSVSQIIPEVIEKEVIKEIIKEVPFEVIKEVEVIKTVEKIINVSDDTEINNLLDKIKVITEEHSVVVDLLKKGRTEQTQTIMKLNKDKDLLIEDFEKKLKIKDEEIIKVKSSKDLYNE